MKNNCKYLAGNKDALIKINEGKLFKLKGIKMVLIK